MIFNNLKDKYVVAGSKPWSRRVFNDILRKWPGEWHFIQSPQELQLKWLTRINPCYIFFLHWSWKVSLEIINKYECVCFHMTDLPYGRGGSPLQNLLVRGHNQTKLTALRMTDEFDAGPVYYKEELCLEGSAEEIYIRATNLAAKLIERIIREQPEPVAQTGKPTIFNRRRPEQSEILEIFSLQELYNFIRMLDAEGYPQAFINYEGFRFEFRRAGLYDGRIEANVTITLRMEES